MEATENAHTPADLHGREVPVGMDMERADRVDLVRDLLRDVSAGYRAPEQSVSIGQR